jgi:hypothetical protein
LIQLLSQAGPQINKNHTVQWELLHLPPLAKAPNPLGIAEGDGAILSQRHIVDRQKNVSRLRPSEH